VKLLHHCAGRTESDRKPEERHLVGVFGSDKSVRDGLATEVDDLANNTAAYTATVLGQNYPLPGMPVLPVMSLEQ
jgi:hypothetical protein